MLPQLFNKDINGIRIGVEMRHMRPNTKKENNYLAQCTHTPRSIRELFNYRFNEKKKKKKNNNNHHYYANGQRSQQNIIHYEWP